MRDIVYFDLETRRTANDAGGWDRKGNMQMSIGVTYSTRSGRYEIFDEARVHNLIERLRQADLVVGFNVLNFDYHVLMGYTVLDLAHELPTVDLMLDMEAKLGHRLGLDAIAQATLGVRKTAASLDAIRWWREGRILEIAEYCCFDVKVTRLVHEYGCRYKELFFHDRFARRQRVEIEWAHLEPGASTPAAQNYLRSTRTGGTPPQAGDNVA